MDKSNESEYALYRRYRDRITQLICDFGRELVALRTPTALADSPPDGRTIIDPPPQPPVISMETRLAPAKPTVTKGLCGWDDMGTPCE